MEGEETKEGKNLRNGRKTEGTRERGRRKRWKGRKEEERVRWEGKEKIRRMTTKRERRKGEVMRGDGRNETWKER